MTIPEYIAKIRKCLTEEVDTFGALDLLEKMASEYPIDNLADFALQCRVRLKQAKQDYNLGILNLDDFYKANNEVTYAILSRLTDIETEINTQQPTKSGNTGRIIHNIPGKMRLNTETFCSVRIAKDDAILLQNFERETNIEPENIELSKIMEVALIDPSNNNAFAIRRINRSAEQAIVAHAFTEWQFGIKPLQPGNHRLLLAVYIITKIDGEKVSRDITFKKDVEVVTINDDKNSNYNFYIENPRQNWEATNIVVNDEARRKKFFGLFGSTSFAKTLSIFLAGVIGLVGIAMGTFALLTPSAATNKKFTATLISIPDNFNITSVQLNGLVITNWNANHDTTEITIYNLDAKTYNLLIDGTNGKCEQTIAISNQNVTLTMPCQVQKIPDAPPINNNNAVNIAIITPFANPILTIDDQNPLLVSKSVPSGGKYKTIYKTTKGQHLLDLIDEGQANSYICEMQQVNVQHNNQTITFNCNKLEPSKQPQTETETNTNPAPEQKPEPEPETKTYDFTLKLNNCPIEANTYTVYVNNNAVKSEMINEKIIIRGLKPGKTNFRIVLNSNNETIGAASDRVTDNPTLNQTTVNCQTPSNNNQSKITVTISTPVEKAIIKFNGPEIQAYNPSKTIVKPDAKGYYARKYQISPGTYKVEAIDLNKKCIMETKKLNTTNETQLLFSCIGSGLDIEPNNEVKAYNINFTANECDGYFENVQVYMDKKNSPEKIKISNQSNITVYNVTKGSHVFKIVKNGKSIYQGINIYVDANNTSLDLCPK